AYGLCERAPLFTGRMLDGTTRLSRAGEPVHTLHYQGTFAEQAVVPERFVTPVRADVPLDVVCGLACGLSTGLGASTVRTPVVTGSSVLVVGAGGVGLSVMMGAKLRAASKVIAIDVMPAKVEKASALGLATHAFLADDPDVVDAVRRLT